MPRLCEVYPGIFLTTEEKVRKNLSLSCLNYSLFHFVITLLYPLLKHTHFYLFLQISMSCGLSRRVGSGHQQHITVQKTVILLFDSTYGKYSQERNNEELNDLYSLPNIVRVVKSRRMRWAGHVARMGEDRGVHRLLVGKPQGKRPLGRPRRRWEDNIEMDL